MAFIKKWKTVFSLLFTFLFLFGCITTETGNRNFNRNVSIRVISGSVNINISGHISENIYLENPINLETRTISNDNITRTQIASQGKETINQQIVLYETQEFEYTLTTSEVVIMNIRSLNDEDARINVTEYGREREYIIIGQNRLGQIITFKN